ncbi:MAG: hypothetical protein KF838_12010 [Phycisphaeraceae bacterium]|nr:MAG: hypothetical protein KF838_12010 [Phycisphaeraceae bacterium]
MPQRINLDEAVTPARKAIDADWSPRKKKIVGGVCVVLGVLAVSAGGVYAWGHRPVSLPTTREEAIAVMGSERYARLDEDRKRQYAVVAAELFKDVSREEMRTYFEDEKTREVLFEMRQEQMDEMILRVARGEPVEDWRTGWRPGGMGGPGGPGGGRPEGDGQRREWAPGSGQGGGPGGGQMTDEQRQQRRAEMVNRINERIGRAVNDGNAQMNGLRSEFMSRMRAQGGGPGGQRPGGGGGGRGPG